MSKTQRTKVVDKHKRIFYSNITYGCNSSCVFCYSHNTKHTKSTYNEVSLKSLVEYWNRMKVTKNDRIIINGGEPLLHTEINEILAVAKLYGCEILIYTNGRLLSKLNQALLDESYRFVVPIHGHESLHDSITREPGSFKEMIAGVKHLANSNALLDLKVIINYHMVENTDDFTKTVDVLMKMPKVSAVHITKMADTIVSQHNKCLSVSLEASSKRTKELFDLFKDKCTVKIFDTCIRAIALDLQNVEELEQPISVFFKDAQHEFDVNLEKPYFSCIDLCKYKEICQSAVGEYTVLELKNNKFCIGLE